MPIQTYTVSEVFGPEYGRFTDSKFMRGSWGIGQKGDNYLIVTRQQPGDPLRDGEIVFPGSRRITGETKYSNARRAVKNEAGIDCFQYTGILIPDVMHEGDISLAKLNEDSICLIKPNGSVEMVYFDSGKAYHFDPVTGHFGGSTPDPQEVPIAASGAKNPRFVKSEELFSLNKNFTAACRIPLEILEGLHKGKTYKELGYELVHGVPEIQFAPFKDQENK